jgi:hypothetical protein
VTPSVEGLIQRLATVEGRLADHAARPVPSGLTDPDPGADERWEAGQVWAHIAEFPAYWMNQVRTILAKRDAGAPEPIPFGRTKADPDRLAAIERDRHEDPAALLRRVRESTAWVSSELRALPPHAWGARGLHPTIGDMDLAQIVERFIVAHLEEHAAQLDALADSG